MGYRRGFDQVRWVRRWRVALVVSLFVAAVALVVLLWPQRFPDVQEWKACESDADCVVSVNVLCADPYVSVHDSCINVRFAERAARIPTGEVCRFGTASCVCSDHRCLASGRD